MPKTTKTTRSKPVVITDVDGTQYLLTSRFLREYKTNRTDTNQIPMVSRYYLKVSDLQTAFADKAVAKGTAFGYVTLYRKNEDADLIAVGSFYEVNYSPSQRVKYLSNPEWNYTLKASLGIGCRKFEGKNLAILRKVALNKQAKAANA